MDVKPDNIVERLRCGDRTAFREVYWEHQKAVYGLAMRYLKDPALAEDAVQDIFLKLWANRSRLDSEKSLSAFLFTTLKHHVLNVIKSRQRRIERHFDWWNHHDPRSEIADEQLIHKDFEEIVTEGLNRLPYQKQQIYRLKREQGFSNEEIALRLGISIHTVKSQYYRATRFMRDYVASRTN